jgi:methionyl-tRNA formyltransferase
MHKKPRIVFMGTPDFAVANLKKLVENDYHIVGVITAPDKPAGRGKKIRKSAVKQYAETLDIPILQPTNLKSEAFNKELQALRPDLQIIVAFRMLPEVVWRLPKLGTFNLHASLLPDYRGAAPINWAIINGENKTGVTTFFIDDKIDTGEIILQKEIDIDPKDNVFMLHDKLIEIGSDLILETVDLITKGKVKTVAQPKIDLPKKAPKLNAENTRIDWQNTAESIHNLVRGLSEYPGAWTMLKINEDEAKKFIIYFSDFEKVSHQHCPGTIISEKKNMKIATKDGYLLPKTVKLQGKKQMDIISFLNGMRGKELRISNS